MALEIMAWNRKWRDEGDKAAEVTSMVGIKVRAEILAPKISC